MGEEIKSRSFSEEDFRIFRQKLREETELVGSWFEEKSFVFENPMVGFELETWLVDRNFQANPINEHFLKTVKDPEIVHELSRFNVELNSPPQILKGGVFSKLRADLEGLWQDCVKSAGKYESDVVMIGILPTLEQKMLNLKNMTRSKRYHALNDQVMQLRNGSPLQLEILGQDELKASHDNVLLESAATSLQIHINIPPEKGARFYNASLLLSAPMVALAANSPFLFGKRLWDETRIPLFEQAVDLNHAAGEGARVSFGSGYLKKSLMELFSENLNSFPPLLPIHYSEPMEQLHHLRLHNGTIWRWNRPIIGIGKEGTHHIRLEHRVAAAGPSILDVIANIAFFIGALESYSQQKKPPEGTLSFREAQDNFYEAARKGLDAKIKWIDQKKVRIKDLLEAEIIPLSRAGLKMLEIDGGEIEHYLGSIILNRVRSGQNGATWQRRCLERYKGDFKSMTESYVNQQGQGRPVHEWS